MFTRRVHRLILPLLLLVAAFATTRIHAEYECEEGYRMGRDGMCHPEFSFSPRMASKPSYGRLSLYSEKNDAEIEASDSDSDSEGFEVPDNQDVVVEPRNRVIIACYPSDPGHAYDEYIATGCQTLQTKYESCGITVLRFDNQTPEQIQAGLEQVYPPLPPHTVAHVVGHGGNDGYSRHFTAGMYLTTNIAEAIGRVVEDPSIVASSCQSGAAFNTASNNFSLATSAAGNQLSNNFQQLGWTEPVANYVSNVMCDRDLFASLQSTHDEIPLVDGTQLNAQISQLQNMQTPQISPNFKILSPDGLTLTHESHSEEEEETKVLVHQAPRSRSRRHSGGVYDDASDI